MSAKTVLIQLHHKASAFEHVGKHLVLSIQREFFDYLRGQFNTSSLRAATKDDSVHFHVYDLLPGEHGFDLRLRERHSTSAAGVEQMLQIGTHTPLSANEIIVKIEAKLGEAREISY